MLNEIVQDIYLCFLNTVLLTLTEIMVGGNKDAYCVKHGEEDALSYPRISFQLLDVLGRS